MKIYSHSHATAAGARRRGAALLLSLMILLILVAIVIQINVSTGTVARISRNDITITTMDLACESALLQMAESLKADADADSSGAATQGAPGAAGATGAGSALPGASATGGTAPSAPAQPTDSRRDEWATPQRTEINNIKLRIITQDENSKYNVLNMLNADEKEAEAAFDRVVRILDACREGTGFDLDSRTAEEMAKTMREHMLKRRQSQLPRPKLLTDDEKNEDQGLPLSMREFLALEPFEELHFRDFRDADQRVVHSITTFLTVWSSLSTNPLPSAGAPGSGTQSGGANSPGSTAGAGAAKSGSTATTGKAGSSTSTATPQSGASATGAGGATGTAAAGGAAGTAGTAGAAAEPGGNTNASLPGAPISATTSGGFGVNVNTAPAAVLKSLFDGREVPGRFWDKVVEYRNLEDEEEKAKAKEADPTTLEEEERLDEYGQPILKRQIFTSVQDLSKVDGYGDLPTELQTKLTQLLTTQSEVFSVFVIARKTTSAEDEVGLALTPAELRKREETRGDALMRVVHAVYWRLKAGDETRITPILRWEVLDYLPYEVLDYPPEDR
ncbi:MAG: hypothetical protein JNL28_08760 [Planctomycetes bacterium]|nr:hypothetical protein [Planctomycetota bacterium]